MPDRTFIKLVYADNLSVSPTAFGATMGQVLYKGNGLFDPQVALGGHQPRGFDEWCGGDGIGWYKRFRVHGSKINVRFQGKGDTSNVDNGPMLGLCPHQDAANAAALLSNSPRMIIASEYPYFRLFWPRNLVQANCGQGSAKHFFSTAKMFGVGKQQVKDDISYAGDTGTDPAKTWLWGIYGQWTDEGHTLGIQIQIKVTYYVEFFDRSYVNTS